MAVMHTAGNGHRLATHAHVREQGGEYLVEFDVSDFAESELEVEALGRRVTVRAEQLADEGLPFRLAERLEESFRLPDDADVRQLKAFYRHGRLELSAPRRLLAARNVPIEPRPLWRMNSDATG